MPERDLGGLGEVKVEEWALQRGITPNRVHHDKKGWDIFLEFPRPDSEAERRTLDIRSPEIACLVQVKATDKRTGKIPRIKVTNWERMAKHALPCFFAVLEYDGEDIPQRAYLIHVGEYWIVGPLSPSIEQPQALVTHVFLQHVSSRDIISPEYPVVLHGSATLRHNRRPGQLVRAHTDG